jgi:REP element-mobilizing transposase RayT
MYREISWYIGGKIMLPTRKNIRLPNYDYRQEGMYFITICTKGKQKVFGTVTQDSIVLSAHGKIVEQGFAQIQDPHTDASIIQHVVMPNHVHAILSIKNNATISLGQMIRQFKAKTSYLCRQSYLAEELLRACYSQSTRVVRDHDIYRKQSIAVGIG